MLDHLLLQTRISVSPSPPALDSARRRGGTPLDTRPSWLAPHASFSPHQQGHVDLFAPARVPPRDHMPRRKIATLTEHDHPTTPTFPRHRLVRPRATFHRPDAGLGYRDRHAHRGHGESRSSPFRRARSRDETHGGREGRCIGRVAGRDGVHRRGVVPVVVAGFAVGRARTHRCATPARRHPSTGRWPRAVPEGRAQQCKAAAEIACHAGAWARLHVGPAQENGYPAIFVMGPTPSGIPNDGIVLSPCARGSMREAILARAAQTPAGVCAKPLAAISPARSTGPFARPRVLRSPSRPLVRAWPR